MVTTTVIYLLSDPATGAVRYVGKTTQCWRRRLSAHIHQAKHGCNHRENWLRSLLAAPLMTTVEEVTGSEADGSEAERRWISRLRNDGLDLTNATDGGEGMLGHRPSEQTRARMSAAQFAAHQRGPRLSPEARARIAAAQRGRKHSPETKAKISAAGLGRTFKHSEETKVKIGAANRGRKHREEFRLRRLGRKFSEQSLEKMRHSALAAWSTRKARQGEAAC